ncbi:MAG: hypothetical protein ACUVSV_13835 [Armatimonadota bacterium]
MSTRVIGYFLITCLLSLVGLGTASYGHAPLSWFLNLGGFLCLLYTLRLSLHKWSSIAHIFVLFSMLYSLSGPAEVIFGTGTLAGFGENQRYDALGLWLADVAIATLGFSLGILAVRLAQPQAGTARYLRAFPYRTVATWCILVASLGELSNMIRAGGLSTLFAGKAVYQAATSDLILTVPSLLFGLMAFVFLGLHYGRARVNETDQSEGKSPHKKQRMLVFTMLAAPLLSIHLILGQRLELGTYLLSFLLGYFYQSPLVRVPPKWVVTGITLYVFFASLFAFRWVIPLLFTGQFTSLGFQYETLAPLFVKALNPASSEFGGTFGNYNLLVTSGYELQYGATYFKALAGMIPAFLYPGQKPPSPVYEFRDQFFPHLALRSRIAGTAFSSIMEARMNFGAVGVFIVYSVFGAFFTLAEMFKHRTRSPYLAAFYCSLGYFATIVHRSGSGSTTSYVYIGALLLMIFLLEQVKLPRYRDGQQGVPLYANRVQ